MDIRAFFHLHFRPKGSFFCPNCRQLYEGKELTRYREQKGYYWGCPDFVCKSRVVQTDESEKTEEPMATLAH